MASIGRKLKQLATELWFNITNRTPDGYFPVDVVGEDGESKVVRYMVSVEFLKSECFKILLDEYEDEIRANKTGPIALPCSTLKFENALCRHRVSSKLHMK